MNSYFLGFVDFVHSKDPNQEINNVSFRACSIGEYSRFIDEMITPLDLFGRMFEDLTSNQVFKVKLENGEFSTYGELQQFIMENY